MSRTLDSAVISALDDALILPILFVDLGFDDAHLYVHTDLGTITLGGHDYLGVGTLGKIAGIAEREDGSPVGLTLELSGIDATMLSEALTQNFFDRPAVIYMGLRGPTGAMLATPFQLFRGKIDQMQIISGGPTSTIRVSVESSMIEFDKSLNRFISDSELQKRYPGDLGFHYLSAMVNTHILLGNKNQATVGKSAPSSTTKP